MSSQQENWVLFSGYAKLPLGITASEMYKVIGVIVVIDMNTGKIVEADCTLATAVARKHVSKALLNQSIQDHEAIIRIIDRIYQGSAKKAVITAIRIIHDKYRTYIEGNDVV